MGKQLVNFITCDCESNVPFSVISKAGLEQGGPIIFGVFRVKNNDFTPTNHIFSNFRGRVPGARLLDPEMTIPYRVHDSGKV
jgi:hypothetical protein